MNAFRPSGMSIPPVVKNLLIINVLFLLGKGILGNIMNKEAVEVLALYFFKSEYFRPWQFITHMFMHGDFSHLFFNMFALFMFGRVLEQVWGPKRFLLYYMVCGLGAAALHFFVIWLDYNAMQEAFTAFKNTPDAGLLANFINENGIPVKPFVYDFIDTWSENPDVPSYIAQGTIIFNDCIEYIINVPTVGASGAVFGLLLAFGMLFPNTQLFLLFLPIPIKAKYFVVIYGVIEFVLGMRNIAGDNIAHFAHLGGMLFGFLLIKYWNKYGSRFY